EGDTTADALLQARGPVRALGHGAAVPSRAAVRAFTSRSTKRAMWPRETRSNYSGRTMGSPRCRRSSTKSEGKNRADSLRDRDQLFAHLVLLDASPAWK